MDHRQPSRLPNPIEEASVAAIALDAVVSIDSSGDIVAWNPRAEAIFGWSQSEAIGRSVADLIIPEVDRTSHRDGLSKYLQTGEGPVINQRIEVQALTKSGELIPVELAISPVLLGDGIYFTAFLRDISDRVRAERELQTLAADLESRVQLRTAELAEKNVALIAAQDEARRGREELQRFIDSMTTMNAKIALDGKPIMINQAGQIAAKIDAESMFAIPIWEQPFCTYDSDVQSRLKDGVLRAGAGERIAYEELLSLFGTLVPVEINLVPVYDKQGNIEYVVGEARDLTVRKAIENELLERTKQLEASNKELEAFCYSVSHDLRAPLRAIDGFSHAIKDEFEEVLDDIGHDYLSRIRASAQKMAQLIDDLLNLSRLALIKLQFSDVNLSKLARDVVEDLRAREPERRLEIKIQDSMQVAADGTLLNSLVSNLLSNAWKFTGKVEEGKIEVGRKRSKGEDVYFVQDNGAGFDMAYGNKLFGVFERLHSPREFPGSGIGLATAARIVERHGGRIWAESKEGEGATFYFTLGPSKEVGGQGR